MPAKAYSDAEFLASDHARTLRMLAEYLEPESRFERENIGDIVVFFGSARALPPEQANRDLAQARARGAHAAELERLEIQVKLARYYDDARELSRMLTQYAREQEGYDETFVICSGGGPGIMEAANRGAFEAGGRSIGLNISLPHEQEPNPYITEALNLEFHYFFMRKLWFVQLACALVAFPGGFGTVDELAEVLTLIQTGRSSRMPVVVYGNEYWDDVLNMEALVRWGTISPEDVDLFHRSDSPRDAFEFLTAHMEPCRRRRFT
jgi:uncharacterized protein (TIGR00730 family)